MQQSAGIEGEILPKIQHLGAIVVASDDGQWTQQPTGSMFEYISERMGPAGEERVNNYNITINQKWT
eukprot:scaffold133571_cov33-Cyclotella_meneghiniana.AAC.2